MLFSLIQEKMFKIFPYCGHGSNCSLKSVSDVFFFSDWQSRHLLGQNLHCYKKLFVISFQEITFSGEEE